MTRKSQLCKDTGKWTVFLIYQKCSCLKYDRMFDLTSCFRIHKKKMRDKRNKISK